MHSVFGAEPDVVADDSVGEHRDDVGVRHVLLERYLQDIPHFKNGSASHLPLFFPGGLQQVEVREHVRVLFDDIQHLIPPLPVGAEHVHLEVLPVQGGEGSEVAEVEFLFLPD